MTETTSVPVSTPQARELSPVEGLRLALQRMTPEFAVALPPQIPAERFVRTLLTTVQMNPALLQADRRSLFAAAMRAAQDGLLLDGREAAAVIFGKGNVQYMPMVDGLLKKLRNSGELASISCHVVFDADEFEYELGDAESIRHKPHLGPNRGKPRAVYAIARTKDGAVYREVMSVEDVERVRNVSRARDAGPWKDWWDRMAIKTCLRRICRRLPSSADLDSVLEADNEASGFVNQPRSQAEATVTQPAADVSPLARLKASIAEPEVTHDQANATANAPDADDGAAS